MPFPLRSIINKIGETAGKAATYFSDSQLLAICTIAFSVKDPINEAAAVLGNTCKDNMLTNITTVLKVCIPESRTAKIVTKLGFHCLMVTMAGYRIKSRPENCQRELNRRYRNVSLEKNSKGFILKIGNRRSNNYFRIYQGKNSLKFEHEMKGKFLQNYHLLLVSNRLDEFEQKLSSHFLVYFGKLLSLEFSYLDWLVLKLRPIRKQPTLQFGLNSDYIKSEILMDTRSFVMLLPFLNYAKHLDFKIEYLGGVAYRQVKVRDFLEFQNPMVKNSPCSGLFLKVDFFVYDKKVDRIAS